MTTTRTLYLDTETTGLDPRAEELVELALLDEHGEPLLDTLVRPVRRKTWPEAARIHGIEPQLVRDAPTLEELVPALERHMRGANVVIYNAAFDWGFMPTRVRQAPLSVQCAMLAFAEYYGDWNEYRQSYRWQKLVDAAAHLGHAWRGTAHRAASDAHACRTVWQFLELDEAGRQAYRERLAATLVCYRCAATGDKVTLFDGGKQRLICAACARVPLPEPSEEIPF